VGNSHDVWHSLFVLSNFSQAGLELAVAAAAVAATSSFLSVTCFGEAFHRLGVQGVDGLILLGALLLPKVSPASRGRFGVMELKLSASIP
jgi:hypothetical protein